MTASGSPAREDVPTPHGPARLHVHEVPSPRALLVLGHGASGGVEAPDLRAATGAALAGGLTTVLVEQPYRAAGRRAPAPAAQLDAAWAAAVRHAAARLPAGVPLLTGGRSSGARVACRTAHATGARGVLCLAFPLRPPRRRSSPAAPPDRQPELDGVQVPTLVVQGERDPFGRPPGAANRTVAVLAGDHRLKADLDGLAAAVRTWLEGLLAGCRPPPGG